MWIESPHIIAYNAAGSVKLLAYVLVYVGVPILACSVRNQTAQSVLGLVYILLLVPFGIVKSIEYYRSNSGNSFFSRLFNVLFRVPLALFGLVCLGGGLSIIGWVLYNILIQKQKEYTGPHLVTGLGSFGVGVPLVLYGFYTLRSVLRRQEEFVPVEEDEDGEFEDDDEPQLRPPDAATTPKRFR